MPVAVTTALPSPVRRRRAAEDHVVPIAERNLMRNGLAIFGDGETFARQCRFRRLQCGRVENSRISRDRVALLDDDDIARDELRRRNVALLAIAEHPSVSRRHLAQCSHRRFGA